MDKHVRTGQLISPLFLLALGACPNILHFTVEAAYGAVLALAAFLRSAEV